jgi:glutamate/tyrosine decarboxylase-like PLP-dependent enzyme
MDISGFGSDALRCIEVDRSHRIDVGALRARIALDRASGLKPFLVVASVGTVDIGAIDDLVALSALCREEQLWLHVDGAFGALGILSPVLAPRLAGIESADSIAFDFHKWGQVPYDAGFLMVRDGERHRQAFAAPAAYLRRETRGLAAGSSWPCDLGPDLSRGFRALKTWFTLKTYGTEKLGAIITRTCALAGYLEARILAEPRLELMAPVNLNIVCFRFRAEDADKVNGEIVIDIQESGIAAPSTTILDGQLAIRAAIVNHRTGTCDIDALISAVLEFGSRRCSPDEGQVLKVEQSPPLAM